MRKDPAALAQERRGRQGSKEVRGECSNSPADRQEKKRATQKFFWIALHATPGHSLPSPALPRMSVPSIAPLCHAVD